MLVWKAMLSITPMMSEMRRELWLISPMVVTTSPTTWPPRRHFSCRTGQLIGLAGRVG